MSNRIQNPETIEKLKSFLTKYRTGYNTFAIVVRTEDGVEEIHERLSRPCYGEMRSYLTKSKNRPEDRFPGDLKNNFPDGTPIGVALVRAKDKNEVREDYFSEHNPWLGRNEEFLTNIIKEEEGIIITSGDIPPTPLVATFMSSRSIMGQHITKQLLKDAGVPEDKATTLSLVSSTPSVYKESPSKNSLNFMGYSPTIHGHTDFNMVLEKDPKDLDDGLLWSDRCDYNRPDISLHFVKDVNVNPMHCMRYPVENFVRKFDLV